MAPNGSAAMSGIGRDDFGQPFDELGARVGHEVSRGAACVSNGELSPGQDAASRRPECLGVPGLSWKAGRVGCSFLTNTDLHVRLHHLQHHPERTPSAPTARRYTNTLSATSAHRPAPTGPPSARGVSGFMPRGGEPGEAGGRAGCGGRREGWWTGTSSCGSTPCPSSRGLLGPGGGSYLQIRGRLGEMQPCEFEAVSLVM